MEKELSINGKRLHRRIDELAQIGKIGDTGVCRLALSKEDLAGVELVWSWMLEAGMKARIDPFGNLIGVLEGADSAAPYLCLAPILIRSHTAGDSMA